VGLTDLRASKLLSSGACAAAVPVDTPFRFFTKPIPIPPACSLGETCSISIAGACERDSPTGTSLGAGSLNVLLAPQPACDSPTGGKIREVEALLTSRLTFSPVGCPSAPFLDRRFYGTWETPPSSVLAMPCPAELNPVDLGERSRFLDPRGAASALVSSRLRRRNQGNPCGIAAWHRGSKNTRVFRGWRQIAPESSGAREKCLPFWGRGDCWSPGLPAKPTDW
jgi:hypothetical protein